MQTNINLNNDGVQYLSDKDIAGMLSVSPSWVRKQRHLRNKGEDHSLTVDPIYIGSSPRYLDTQIQEWLKEISTINNSKN